MTESYSRFSSKQILLPGEHIDPSVNIPFAEELTAMGPKTNLARDFLYAQKPNLTAGFKERAHNLQSPTHKNQHHHVQDRHSSIEADLDTLWPKKPDMQAKQQHDFNFDDKLANNVEARSVREREPNIPNVEEPLTHGQISPSSVFSAKDERTNPEHASVLLENQKYPSIGPVIFDKASTGGRMADLSAYRDLSKAPMNFGDDDMSMSSSPHQPGESAYSNFGSALSPSQPFVQQDMNTAQEVDTEFSGNVKTLIRLVNELPEGVTKQTGAQIIRLTMEAMGISMENVLSEAQSAQSEMLDAVRANIKKIEEYKTVIRKLETDIKYYQGKANELSEIIDLFILSNTSGQKVPFPDDLSH
jgi:hypothetical protein